MQRRMHGQCLFFKTLLFVLTALLLVPGYQSVAQGGMDRDEGDFVPGEVIVAVHHQYLYSDEMMKSMEKTDGTCLYSELFAGVDMDSVKQLTNGKKSRSDCAAGCEMELVLVKLKDKSKQDILEAIEELKKNPAVKYAEPNYLNTAYGTYPNDPDYSQQYALNLICAPEAWDITTGDKSVMIGVIDNGIYIYHDDLHDYVDPDESNIWHNMPEHNGVTGVDDDGNGYVDDKYGMDFTSFGFPLDIRGHGTHVAGTIAAKGNNHFRTCGVAWEATLVPIKVYDDNPVFPNSMAIQGIEYATDNGFPIINMSWGSQSYSQIVHDLIAGSDSLFIAAAGNAGTNNDTNPHYPACYDCPNLISVAATDQYDDLWVTTGGGSNYGQNSVDLAAPGQDILSLYLENQTTTYSGTSVATPFVTGTAALLKSYQPSLTAMEIKDIILNNVDIVPDLINKTVSGGRLNAYKALAYLVQSHQIDVGFYNQVRNHQTNMIYPNFQITNQDGAMDLSDLKIRYYYTKEGSSPENFWCDYGGVTGSSGSYRNITNTVNGDTESMDSPVSNADSYLEVGFGTGAGTLENGETMEVKTRFAKNDWSNYTQTNDYSFNPTATNYADWSGVAVYYGGVLVYGYEP